MLGAGRAATLKNARQKTEEMQAQQISMIIMPKNAAFAVPRLPKRRQVCRLNSPQFLSAPIFSIPARNPKAGVSA